jgi:hypothetical protein
VIVVISQRQIRHPSTVSAASHESPLVVEDEELEGEEDWLLGSAHTAEPQSDLEWNDDFTPLGEKPMLSKVKALASLLRITDKIQDAVDSPFRYSIPKLDRVFSTTNNRVDLHSVESMYLLFHVLVVPIPAYLVSGGELFIS